MNLNASVVLPINKAKPVKINGRNMQELRMDTLTLDDESKEMEEKLQQLKDSMSKEKEERGHSRELRWTSGKKNSISGNALPSSFKKNKGTKIQKVSAAKQKIRVLKEEPLSAPSKPPPPSPTTGHGITRGNRVKGKICGQCEVKTAGLTDLQTHVSTHDVVSSCQRQINSDSFHSTRNPSSTSPPNFNHTIASNTTQGGESQKKTGTVEKHMKLHQDCCQMFVLNDGERKVRITEDEELGSPSTLLTGQYSEEESAQYFQEALRQWRGERRNGREQTMTTNAMWTPVRSVLVSAVATQADLPPERETEGQMKGKEEGKVTVKVEFAENGLTYMERLLLQKHRRTPVQSYPSLDLGTDSKSSPTTDTVEETANNLTGEEEDFHRYYTSLFAPPVSRGRTEPQTSTRESCLVIEILDETCSDKEKACAAEQKMDKSKEVPSVQQISRRKLTGVSKMALSSNRSTRVGLSSPSKTQPSRQSCTPVQSKAAKKLHSSQTSQPEHLVKALSSKRKTSTCSTAVTSGTSKKSMRKTTTKSSMSICSPSTMKSKANRGSPLILSLSPDFPKSSPSPLSFFAEVSASDGNMSAIPKEHPSNSPSVSFSLRSTFTVSPLSSTQSTLLPKVYHSALLQKDSDSSLLSEKPQSSLLFAEPISSLKLCKAPQGNLISQQQSQHSMCDPDCLLLEDPLNHTLSTMSATPHPKPESLEPIRSLLSPVPCEVNANSCCRSAGKYDDASVFMSSTPISVDQKSAWFLQDPRNSSSSSLKIIINNPVKVEDVKELSIDSEDEMSSDSLCLAEEDSSDEETEMKRRLTKEKSKEENHDPVLSQSEDSFILAEAETKNDLLTDEPEQQSKSFMVMQKQSAGFGSEQFCDLDGFLPPGLDTDTGHLSSTEHAHCEPLHTCHSSVHDSDPTGCNPSDKPTPILFNPPRKTPRPLSAPTSSSVFCTPSPPLSARLSHLTSGSEFCPASRPFSRATIEIMEICGVDQTGCEDPDLEMDTTVHMLHSLEEELKVIANGTHALVLDKGNRGSQNGTHSFKRVAVSEGPNEEEEAVERDRQSVLLLP